MGWQVHGTELLEWDEPPESGGFAAPGAELPQVDGHLTAAGGPRPARAGGGLPAGGAGRAAAGWRCCTAAGAGWPRGSSSGRSTRFDEPPAAAIGPGIGPCCYEVGEEVLAAFAELEGVRRRAGCSTCARWRGASSRRRASSRIEDVDLCTSCREDLFFSHRRDGGVTGRQGGLAWIPAG